MSAVRLLLIVLALVPATAVSQDSPTTAAVGHAPVEGEPEVPAEGEQEAEAATQGEPEAVAPIPAEVPGAAATEPAMAFPLDLHDVSELAVPVTARVSASGRVGSGLVVNGGTHVITLLHTVRVGYPAAVQTGSGHISLARIVTWDRLHELALLELDEPIPELAAPVFAPHPLLGEGLVAFGHGGSIGLSIYDEDVRALTTFTPLPMTVLAQRLPTEEEQDARIFPDFLVDRAPGAGDRGAPVFNGAGEVVGMLREAVADAGGRSLVIPAAALADLLEAPQDRRYRRPSHLQTWSGFGVAAHNRPSMVAGLLRVGLRVAVLDALRIEPWVEGSLGTRAPFIEEDETGAIIGSRPRDLWWSIDAGMDFGYRIPIPVEGSRDYIVPNVGFRLGWNRFQHARELLVADCEGADCSWETQKETDQLREFRAGIDLGIDVRHGRVRFGYRFFLDPTAVAAHSMHRLIITFDGFPLDIAVGDSR